MKNPTITVTSGISKVMNNVRPIAKSLFKNKEKIAKKNLVIERIDAAVNPPVEQKIVNDNEVENHIVSKEINFNDPRMGMEQELFAIKGYLARQLLKVAHDNRGEIQLNQDKLYLLLDKIPKPGQGTDIRSLQHCINNLRSKIARICDKNSDLDPEYFDELSKKITEVEISLREKMSSKKGRKEIVSELLIENLLQTTTLGEKKSDTEEIERNAGQMKKSEFIALVASHIKVSPEFLQLTLTDESYYMGYARWAYCVNKKMAEIFAEAGFTITPLGNVTGSFDKNKITAENIEIFSNWMNKIINNIALVETVMSPVVQKLGSDKVKTVKVFMNMVTAKLLESDNSFLQENCKMISIKLIKELRGRMDKFLGSKSSIEEAKKFANNVIEKVEKIIDSYQMQENSRKRIEAKDVLITRSWDSDDEGEDNSILISFDLSEKKSSTEFTLEETKALITSDELDCNSETILEPSQSNPVSENDGITCEMLKKMRKKLWGSKASIWEDQSDTVLKQDDLNAFPRKSGADGKKLEELIKILPGDNNLLQQIEAVKTKDDQLNINNIDKVGIGKKISSWLTNIYHKFNPYSFLKPYFSSTEEPEVSYSYSVMENNSDPLEVKCQLGGESSDIYGVFKFIV